jgi:hypothetical protein
MAQFLGGSDVAFEIPGLGAFPGRNITPDKETGIGSWTSEQIVTALQAGKRPDGLRDVCRGVRIDLHAADRIAYTLARVCGMRSVLDRRYFTHRTYAAGLLFHLWR